MGRRKVDNRRREEKGPVSPNCPKCRSTDVEATKGANLRCGDCGHTSHYKHW